MFNELLPAIGLHNTLIILGYNISNIENILKNTTIKKILD